jgi:O-antigen ligase
MLFMVVYCARPEDWIPGLSALPLAKIVGVLSALAFLWSLAQIGQRFPPEVIFVLLLIGQLFATVPFSPVWRGGAFMHALDFAKVGFIVLVMVMAVTAFERLRQLLFIQAASVATVCGVTVLKGRMRGGRLEGILNGNYANPNDLALAIVISLPLCLALFFLSKRILWKILWAVAMAVMAYALLLTGSRGGFLALAMSGGVCLWEFAIRGRRFYLLPLAALLGTALLVLSSGIMSQRLGATFDDKDDATSSRGSAQARQRLLWRSLEITAEHPLFGVGPGNFAVISGSWHETHNSFTQMSSEAGIPALVFYVIILWRGFKNVRIVKKFSRNEKQLRLLAGALHASLAGFVIGSFFASVAYQFFPYFIVIYTTALLRIARESIDRDKVSKTMTQAIAQG